MKYRTAVMLSPLLLAACAPGDLSPGILEEVPETEWWVLEETQDIGAETPSDEQAGIWGELELRAQGYAGSAVVEVWQEGEKTCDVTFELTETGPAGSCSMCTVQMELTASAVEVSEDQGCGLVNIDPAYLEGQTMSMGGGEGVLWMMLEGSWEQVGVVEQEDGRFAFEVRFEEG